MGISGSLEDVSVSEVLQFIHLGKRTGTLELRRRGERAVVGFHTGRMIGARAPGTPKVGDLLVSARVIDERTLAAAVAEQEREGNRLSLGQILVARGAIEGEALRNVIVRQIKQAVGEILRWEDGTFDFAVDDLEPVDDIMLRPGEVLPEGHLNTQMVMLEAARIFDERSRVEPPAPDPTESASGDLESLESLFDSPELHETLESLGGPTPEPAADLLELHVVSTDEDLLGTLQDALSGEFARITRVHLSRAGEAPLGAPPPFVLVDLRRGGLSPELVAALHHARPRASLLAVVEPGINLSRIYAAGALAAVTDDTEALLACITNAIGTRRDLARGRRRGAPSDIARLQRVFGDLRSGMMSATVALSLMHAISESVERAVLFLVRRSELVALGAFGRDRQDRHLAIVTKGLRLPLEGGGAIERSIRSGRVLSLPFVDAGLPEPFRSLVGEPRNGQVVIFPVAGAQGVISVVYADNGSREELVEDIEILELATAQVGIAFENELLRRKMEQRR